MKKLLITLIISVAFFRTMAHVGGHGVPMKEWTLEKHDTKIKADFIKLENKTVWLSNESHQHISHALTDFSSEDQLFILSKHETIRALNASLSQKTGSGYFERIKPKLLAGGMVLLLITLIFYLKKKSKFHLAFTSFIAISMLVVACKDDEPLIIDPPGGLPSNDVTFMKTLFESFSGVSTSSDDTYFYVSSNGLPDHNMMIGITNWQQQVPIDHNYTGNNSWAIPLRPEIGDEPLSTQTNLLKGAIAIAANGIPIFNPLNNRGEDANAIGELDQWGGHCGRADDYHYHIPPTHLQSTVGEGNPIAYSVDGFPVYGSTTETLDECLGRYNDNGGYQYHTIDKYPYFMAKVKGKVTLDPNTTAPENQVIPQATTKGVRPALTPLSGARITDFKSTGTNAYSLTYTVNSETHTINYSWDANGNYTYEFVGPGGTTTEKYKR